MDNDEGERAFRGRLTNVMQREGRGSMMGAHLILPNAQKAERELEVYEEKKTVVMDKKKEEEEEEEEEGLDNEKQRKRRGEGGGGGGRRKREVGRDGRRQR